MDISKASSIELNPLAATLIDLLSVEQERLGLQDANLYYDFPLYRDEEEGGVVSTKVLLISRRRGVFIFGTTPGGDDATELLAEENAALDHVYSHVFSRLMKNKKLRKSKQEVSPPVKAVLYAPSLTRPPAWTAEDTKVVWTQKQVLEAIAEEVWAPPADIYTETIATLEGAKGLLKPAKRNVESLALTAKGRVAMEVEAEITTFDLRQKNVALISFSGPQRIRGLAGSGKTVVLAMKAALLLIREPQARILFTFWTRHLHQHVRRLITRFYRQFHDVDPDWTQLQVMHGWGGSTLPGTYYTAATAAGIQPLNFQEASKRSRVSPFGFACSELLKQPIKPLYDYVLIDEAQDYPLQFIQLCARLAEGGKFVIAYDELQNIFQTEAPRAADILGTTPGGGPVREFEEDVVLQKCYRNPREIILCAHAVGFGIYGKHVIQMLENRAHWEDVGYRVLEGDFTAGSHTIIERPEENSLASISRRYNIDELAYARAFTTLKDEIDWVVTSIQADLAEGLKPEDILVITVDDRNAKLYLVSMESALSERGIQSHNVHEPYADNDFQKCDSITLSTVHKAKGNEAYMVYVVGIDALYPSPGIRQRNMLFTAMTRAKGWLRVTGISPAAESFIEEIQQAKANFPRLVFKYPSPEELKVMRRDLRQSASRRIRAERLLEQLAEDLSPEEIADILKRRESSAAKASKLRG